MHLNGAFESELDGVSNQIEKHLLVSLRVRVHFLGHILLDLGDQLQALGLNLEVHDVLHFFQGFPDVEEVVKWLELAILNSLDVQSIVDHIFQVVG